jgi:two-component system alkaline phosphatase synthesis response regulator PhoP
MALGRILVADDETHIVQVLALKFRNAGYEVFEAHDGEEALDLARRTAPDVVVTDYQMPFMNGAELAEALSLDPNLCDVPVMILTARGWGLDETIASIPNIRHVESKPFSPRAVLTMVEQMIDESRQGRKAA